MLQHCGGRFGGLSGSDYSFLRKLGNNYLKGIHSSLELCQQKNAANYLRNRPQFNLKFKADIDLYMLILATHFKPKTSSNEKEHRIVFFHYDLSGRARKLECYALSNYRFGTCLHPYIECRFNEENRSFFDMIRSVTLSPTTVKMPFDSNAYRGVICNFLNQYGGDFSVEQIHLSGHDIRW